MTDKFIFGKLSTGEPVFAACITNKCGASITVLSYGATIQKISVPNIQGGFTDVVLGYDTAEQYENYDSYLGATIGRFANRIGGSKFSLGGKIYSLNKNDGDNHLHGGAKGFDKQIWNLETNNDSILCSRTSINGEEGYPGSLKVNVQFNLNENNEVHIIYDAISNMDTVVNLTNHSYFNLSGSGNILKHMLKINAERFLENDANCLPTGRILSVESTAFDFRTFKMIGKDLYKYEQQLLNGKGYDHNFVLSGSHAASLVSEYTGICMDVITDLPGMQLYTSNVLSTRSGKKGQNIGKYSGVCLETQLFPNAMNCWGFPSPILRANTPLHTETVLQFKTMRL